MLKEIIYFIGYVSCAAIFYHIGVFVGEQKARTYEKFLKESIDADYTEIRDP